LNAVGRRGLLLPICSHRFTGRSARRCLLSVGHVLGGGTPGTDGEGVGHRSRARFPDRLDGEARIDEGIDQLCVFMVAMPSLKRTASNAAM
jgi:hypothetical protein